VALPFQHEQYAFWFVMAVIVVVIAGMINYFQKRNWL
jgi:Mg2+ and Co2+ transporter CorA